MLLLAVSLSAIDILALLRRIVKLFRSGEIDSINTFWRAAILGKETGQDRSGPEYIGLVVDEEEFEEAKISLSPVRQSGDLDPIEEYSGDTAQWANDVHHHRHHYRQQSTASDGTIFGTASPMRSLDKIQPVKSNSKVGLLRRIGQGSIAVLERLLVFAGLAQTLLGIVIYTGAFWAVLMSFSILTSV